MSLSAQFHVMWRVYPHLDLLQMSGLLSGMSVLARKGIITLSMEFVATTVSVPYAIMELVVTHRPSGRTRHVVFDFYDREDRIPPEALAFSDVYFKRQLGPHTRESLTQAEREKIRPLGLTIPGYSRDTLRLLWGALVASVHSAEARRTFSGPQALAKHAFTELRLWIGVDPTRSTLLMPVADKQPSIVFQPRLWRLNGESTQVFDDANIDRIASVQALRSAFGSPDTIGLMRTKVASELAPDLQLVHKVSTSAYHEQLRTALIAVNCVGLSGSLGWKLAEYLAAGNAVVSQPITKELLAPLEPDVHYLPYTTPDECVAQCRRLLDDRALAARMGANNRRYFEQWTHPEAHALTLLEQAFA